MPFPAFPDINTLLSFLRLDSSRMQIEKATVTANEFGLKTVELYYYDIKTKELNHCIIGINGIKNALTTR